MSTSGGGGWRQVDGHVSSLPVRRVPEWLLCWAVTCRYLTFSSHPSPASLDTLFSFSHPPSSPLPLIGTLQRPFLIFLSHLTTPTLPAPLSTLLSFSDHISSPFHHPSPPFLTISNLFMAPFKISHFSFSSTCPHLSSPYPSRHHFHARSSTPTITLLPFLTLSLPSSPSQPPPLE